MIKFDNEPFVQAVDQNADSPSKIAHKADSSPDTMRKVLNGETDLNLSSVEKLAGYLGFDVQISFVVKQKEAATV